MYSKKHVACSTRRDKGTCSNSLTIGRDVLEAAVIDGLRTRLMEPAYFKEFCREYTKDLNRTRREQRSALDAQRREYDKIDTEMEKLVDAICEGVPAAKVKDHMIKLEQRSQELEIILNNAREPEPLLHPNMAEVYADKLDHLAQALSSHHSGVRDAEKPDRGCNPHS